MNKYKVELFASIKLSLVGLANSVKILSTRAYQDVMVVKKLLCLVLKHIAAISMPQTY